MKKLLAVFAALILTAILASPAQGADAQPAPKHGGNEWCC